VDDEELVVDDELIGIPPGEVFDDGCGELELNGVPNAGAEMPDGGAETSPGGDALESSDPPAGWPVWASFASRPLPPAEPIEPCNRASALVIWPELVSVDESPRSVGVPPDPES